MEIQSIRSSEKLSLPAMMAAMTATSSSCETTSSSTWRKFTSDMTVHIDEKAGIEELLEQMQRAWEAKQYDEIIRGLDLLLERHLPAFDSLVSAFLISLKSKCHEEMGRYDVALIEAEKAIEEFQKHGTTLNEFLSGFKADYDAEYYLQMRKAGLLLNVGREDEAFAYLRDHQPKTSMGVLLYRLLDKESKLSLLVPTPAVDESCLEDLFFAGRYAEVIEKLEKPYPRDPATVRLHAAALAMVGRTEEALEVLRQMSDDYSSFAEDAHVYALIQAIDGHPEGLLMRGAESEFTSGLPLQLFAIWLLNR